MNPKILVAIVAAVWGISASAQANVYQLKFAAGADAGVVDFTTSGALTAPITSVSGEIDGSAITGLSTYASADNVLYDGYPNVSFGGVSVSTALDTFNFANGNVLFLEKASTDPAGLVYIPGSEVVDGYVNPEAGRPDAYQLDFGAGTDSGEVDFTTSGPLTAPITGVSGEIDGAAITGLSTYAGADNILYDNYPYMSFAGVSVSTAVDSYNFGDVHALFLSKESTDPQGFLYLPGSALVTCYVMDVSSVPEPATWSMLIVGAGSAGCVLRRRRRHGLAAVSS